MSEYICPRCGTGLSRTSDGKGHRALTCFGDGCHYHATIAEYHARETIEPLRAQVEQLTAERDAAVQRAEAAERELAQVREAQRWMPVGERLPEDSRHVLTYGAYDYDAVCWWRKDHWVNCYDTTLDMSGVTHWRPLPESPQEGN